MRLTRITLIALALVIGLGFCQLVHYLLDDVDAQTFQATEEVMVDTAYILAAIIEGNQDKNMLHQAYDNVYQKKISAQIYNHLKTHVGLNAYLTDKNGIILFDSKNSEQIGKDYSDFNDVRLTLAGKYGARSTRNDESDDQSSIMYVGAPVHHNGEISGVLTVYKSQTDVLHFITDRRNDILFATVMIGGGILLFTIAVFTWLFRPIGKLTEYTQAISRGERLPLPHLGKGKEVNTLGNALHHMRETLEGRHYVESYVSSLTHELKSPLAAIRGSAELLKEDTNRSMPDEQRKLFISNILKETQRSEQLVIDLVQLAEIERISSLNHQSSFSLTRLCQEICDSIQTVITDQRISLKQQLTPSISVCGDAMLLKLAINNLLENAISFTPAGGEISITLRADEKAIKLTILDSGPGLPDYAQSRIFEHFYSLPRPESEKKGTGLGLPLAKEALLLHGGSVTLANTAGGGCIATIVMPL